MTASTFARDAAPIAGADQYVPGTCNIGPAEIARRRKAGHVGALLSLGLLTALVAIDAPPLARLTLILPAMVSASGYLQAHFKFCAAYGSQGVFNFGRAGATEAVADADAQARDRRRSRQIGLMSFAIGSLVGIVAVLLPI